MASRAFAELASRVETRIEELRRRSLDELAALPDSNAEDIDIPGGERIDAPKESIPCRPLASRQWLAKHFAVKDCLA